MGYMPDVKNLQGVKIVDVDSHLCERYDLWTSRAPAAYKDRVPQVKFVDGKPNWFLDGNIKMGLANPITSVRADGVKVPGLELLNMQFEDTWAATYDTKARVAYLDRSGITSQVLYPNLLGFGNQKSMGVDTQLRNVVTQIFNDEMIQIQQDSGGRVLPMALLPWWDMDLSLAEVKRAHAGGLRGINTNSRPEAAGLPPLNDKHWNPLWELAQDLDMPINFHIGGGFDTADWFGEGCWSENTTERLAWGSTSLFFPNYQLLANIFLTRFCENFPKLKIVSVESGVGWINFLLEAVQHFMHEEKIPHKTPVKEIFERQMYACAWFEKKNFAHDTRSLGVENVMVQTDFPHPVCLYPEALKFWEEVAEPFTASERRKIFGGNAAKVYNLAEDGTAR